MLKFGRRKVAVVPLLVLLCYKTTI
jgi:hypothetical protein